MELSREQQTAFDKYVQGKNIFITGPGGSGKSALIKKIYKHATDRHINIHVCALTGCAAILLNCNAKTLHSWSGIGLGNSSIEKTIQKVNNNNYAKTQWKTTQILIIDEVSMMSLKLFNMLNEIGKALRKNGRPFGGIQLIFSGDFYQLPPVGDKDDIETTAFCFESDDWNSVFHKDCQIQLVKIFRQSDEVYSSMLNQIREGKIKRKTNDLLVQHVNRIKPAELLVEPTKLFPTKNKVENINQSKLTLLDSESKVFEIKYITDLPISKSDSIKRAQWSPKDIQNEIIYLEKNLVVDPIIQLKKGAQVMCVINIIDDNREIIVCNGSQGIITGFCEITGYPRVKFNNKTERVMARHTWLSEKIPGIGVSQVPLILAWALTIHKSQGATLDIAEIDAGSGIFECGQTYVALSRVKSLEGLYLTSFDISKIKVNKKVQNYYEMLKTYQESIEKHHEIYEPVIISEIDPETIFDKFSYTKVEDNKKL